MTITAELEQLKAAHRVTWASGDYDAVAQAFVRDVGATAVAAAAIAPGEDVLDVAAGSGNAAIPAASAGARVTALDLVPELLAAGEAYADAAGVDDRVGAGRRGGPALRRRVLRRRVLRRSASSSPRATS